MPTLHIEHPITDFGVWSSAFGRFAEARRQAGVRAQRIQRPAGDPRYVVIDLDFETCREAETFLRFLTAQVWGGPESAPALAGSPKTMILEPAPATAGVSGPGKAEDNKALVRRFYKEIDEGDLDAMDELVAENYLDHSPPPFPGIGSGREGLKQAFRMFWDATPGRHEIEDQITEGDKVVTRLTAYGIHQRDLPGIPATGRQIKMTGTVVHRIENRKIAEKWSDKDVLGLLQQLGVLPVP